MERLDQLSSVGESVAAIIEAIPEDASQHPTPCGDWSVRELADHLLRGNLNAVAVLNAVPPPDRSEDVLTDDWAATQRRSIAGLVAGFTPPGTLAKLYRAPAGEVPGDVLLTLRSVEQTVHGWDLARATGQSVAALNEPAAALYEPSAVLLERLGGRRPNPPFAPSVTVHENSQPIDRLVALLGRDPLWQPPAG
jgi:uncharacterized protein (TIGR03086 family)